MKGTKVDLKAVPNFIWGCLTAAFLGCLTAVVVMGVTGTDATEFRSFLNTVLNFGALVVSGGGAIYAGAAARNSQVAREQTNGALDKRIQDAVTEALSVQRTDDIATGYGKEGGDSGRTTL
jgi:hypothetical protein